eukprot:TRINITY_DN1538_c0_g1_i1.p1 TRINITY_DN1538_c0_g1~~TRINITY_DN1538_c0_g1_i1.p1  ORF type:complete len:187 (+),score=37.32 TRINITY_DN1538_c0_g1_i1:439-999(+)
MNDMNDSTYPNLAAYKNFNPIIKFKPPTIAEFKARCAVASRSQSERKDSSLQYKILKSEARLVQAVFEANGFAMTEGHSWNVIWSNGNPKAYVYEGINPYQRVNHFPSSYEVTRKDKLCENVGRMQRRFGKGNFDIIPETYILPDDFNNFYTHFMQLKSQGIASYWIVKPNALSRGRGIFIVSSPH